MIRRDISNQILEVSNHFPVVLITGARQVGKTTLFNNLITSQKIKREYVTLDALDERALAQTDPKMFLQTHKPPVFIDEVQYAPNLFTYIKIHVDSSHKNGDFWLTGSQKFELMKNVSESLAGRVAIIDLLGISQSEIQNDNSSKTNNKKQTLPFLLDDNWLEYKRNENINFLNVDDIYKIIFRGSYPKLIADPKLKRETFYSSYIQSYIERDVKALLNCPTLTLANPYRCHSINASTMRGPLLEPGVPLSWACTRYAKSGNNLPSMDRRTSRVLKLSFGVASVLEVY